MSVLWCAAGEDIEFPVKESNTVTNTGTTAARRTTYVRACLEGYSGATAGTVLADGVPLASPVTDCWLSSRLYQTNVSLATSQPAVGLGGSAAVGGLFVGQSTVINKLGLFSVTSTGTKTLLASEVGTTFTAATLQRIDMQITGFGAPGGNVKVYLNSNSVATIDFTGDLTLSGVTNLDRVRFVSDGGNGSDRQYLSEAIIADEDTRNFVAVCSLAPSAAGDTNTFDSGAYTDIDEAVLNDVDMIVSATAAQEFNCNLTDLPAGDFSIRAVKLTARAAKGATGPGTLKLGIKSGGTVNTVDKTLTTAFLTYERLMLVNPVTTVAFTHAEVDALLADVKSAT